MTYIVAAKNGVKELRTGRSWSVGQTIGPAPFPPHVWEALLSEGAVVQVEAPTPEPKPTKTKKAPAKKVKDDNQA